MNMEFDTTDIACLLDINPRPIIVLDLENLTSTDSIIPIFTNTAFRNEPFLQQAISRVGEYTEEWHTFRAWVGASFDNHGGKDSAQGFAGTEWTRTTHKSRWRVICASKAEEKSDAHLHPHPTIVQSGTEREGGCLHTHPKSPCCKDHKALDDRFPTAFLRKSHFSEKRSNKSKALPHDFYQEWAKQVEIPSAESDALECWSIQFKALAGLMPVGIAVYNAEEELLYANDLWYGLIGVDVQLPGAANKFRVCIGDEHDVNEFDRMWKLLRDGGTPEAFQIKLMAPANGNTMAQHRWVLGSCTREEDVHGNLRRIIFAFVDITHLKEASEAVNNRARDAETLSHNLSQLRSMASLATVAICDIDTDGSITEANEAFYKLTGIAKSDSFTHDQDWIAAVDERDHEKAYSNFIRSLAGHPTEAEFRIKNNPWISKDNAGNVIKHQRWLLSTTLPLRNSEGQVVAVSACLTDISAQKAQSEAALERADLLSQVLASQERFSRFASAAPIGITMLNVDGDILFCNDTWNQLMRQEKNPEIATFDHWRHVILPEDDHVVVEAWLKLVTSKEACKVTYAFRLKWPWQPPKDQVVSAVIPTWVMVSSIPEFGPDGKVTTVMSCVADISQFKWQENAQKQRILEALESKRQQENFIDMTSHEIRNPLSAIIQCSDMVVSTLSNLKVATAMGDHKDIDASIDAARTIISCAQHQRRIVDDILTMSKLDSRLLSIAPVPCTPLTVLQTAHQMFKSEAAQLGVELIVAEDDSMKALGAQCVSMDPSRVQQVLINLLTNAIKFTQTGLIRSVTITLSASATQPSESATSIFFIPRAASAEKLLPTNDDITSQPIYLLFTVQDTGRGLSLEEKTKLFRRFSQASPKTHVHYGGSGLGLYISRKLTEMQGGQIGVASEQGVGSTFAFFVKTYRSVPTQDALVTPPNSSDGTGSAMSQVANIKSVLIVEDNLINQAVLVKQLNRLGYTTYIANHGGEALSVLEKSQSWRSGVSNGNPIDVVLMDIEMPIMDGLTCCQTIRALEKSGEISAHIPIIAISANARIEQISAAKAAGMDDFIVKPFRIPELVSKMHVLLNRLDV